MFIVRNGLIENSKELNIGLNRSVNILFDFDIDFQDTDTFQLTIGTQNSVLYGFMDNGCISFPRFNFNWVSSSSQTSKVIVKRNQEIILNDTLTISAIISGGGGSGGGSADLSNYVGEIHINNTQDVLNLDNNYIMVGETTTQNLPSGNYNYNISAKGKTITIGSHSYLQILTESVFGQSGLFFDNGNITVVNTNTTLNLDCKLNFGNKAYLPYIYNSQSPRFDIYNQSYSDGIVIPDGNQYINLVNVTNQYSWVSIELGSFMNNGSDKQTTELWLRFEVNKDIISIAQDYQVIGEIPEKLQAKDEEGRYYYHVFVIRQFYLDGMWVYLLNYSHSFVLK